ncbi:Uncharacterized protein OBRU01_19128 [Operophtera brumata]|uniref:60S ribosome subunit biogenesis protein NIP7 homolog n=1 Tax=Operophtera brumata TaxID=104452 RepID=A0A0L7KVD4_OPEBR|nr:Uncharacterized protein OBRU01_19128 [Operophtera brumata]
MKVLSEDRTRILFEKLTKYITSITTQFLVIYPNKVHSATKNVTKVFFSYFSIGVNVKLLIDRPDGTYCFREKKDRVYYISERLLQLAHTVKPEHLISAGTCFGKFTKTNKFRLHITALTYIAPYAPYKLWHQGVVVLTMSDVPIGFGVAAKTTAECRSADPLATVVFHQADIGEYIRSEDTLT